MKTLEEIRTKFWFALPGGKPARLDERDWKQLLVELEAGGWVLVPKKPTDEMRGKGRDVLVGGPDKHDAWVDWSAAAYAAMIEAKPK